MVDPVGDFISGLLGTYAGQSNTPDRKWEFWADGRRRSHTICVTLHGAEVTIAHRAVGTDGHMSTLHAFTCDIEHLPQLAHSLSRALAVAQQRGSSNNRRNRGGANQNIEVIYPSS